MPSAGSTTGAPATCRPPTTTGGGSRSGSSPSSAASTCVPSSEMRLMTSWKTSTAESALPNHDGPVPPRGRGQRAHVGRCRPRPSGRTRSPERESKDGRPWLDQERYRAPGPHRADARPAVGQDARRGGRDWTSARHARDGPKALPSAPALPRLAGVTRPELFEDENTRATTKPITFHDLRATGITWCAIRGDEPLRIKYRAGHSTLSTTESYIREAENLRAGFGVPFPPLPPSLVGEVDQTTGAVTPAAPSTDTVAPVPEVLPLGSGSATPDETRRPVSRPPRWRRRELNPILRRRNCSTIPEHPAFLHLASQLESSGLFRVRPPPWSNDGARCGNRPKRWGRQKHESPPRRRGSLDSLDSGRACLMRMFLVPLVCFDVGCADAECAGSFTLDAPGAADERTILAAMARFDHFAGTSTKVDPSAMCRVSTRDALSTTNATGEYEPASGEIRLDMPRIRAACEGQPDECAQAFVVHELGHSYGLGHVRAYGGIMGSIQNPRMWHGREFSRADVDECKRVGLCRNPRR